MQELHERGDAMGKANGYRPGLRWIDAVNGRVVVIRTGMWVRKGRQLLPPLAVVE
jgi:hypothetical protein